MDINNFCIFIIILTNKILSTKAQLAIINYSWSRDEFSRMSILKAAACNLH